MINNFQPVIGLEIHVELKTISKMFCQCLADYFGKSPNSQVCPVCLGLPGALPVPNRQAIDWTILIGKALNCQINSFSKFDRKHYFYPDLPKGYQISQYDLPFCENGFLEIYPSLMKEEKDYQKLIKKFRIRRVHLEEDTGKLIHEKKDTLIDFNRSGVPLVEIVTEPDFTNSEDVKRFLEELQVLIRYLGVSDCDMEKGTMRLEPNISLKYQSDNLPNYKIEVKNINSFRFVKQAIDYEIKRQINLLEKGVIPQQETRGFDSKKGITYSQRSKEEAHDYRYFPEPDIPPIILSKKEIEQIDRLVSPFDELKELIDNYHLRYNDAFLLTRDKEKVYFFKKLINKFKQIVRKKNLRINNFNQKVANLLLNRKISFESDDEFINKALLILVPPESDEKLLISVVKKIITKNSKAVSDYKKGKKGVLMFLVGQVMKELRGKVSAKEVMAQLTKMLD